MKFLRRSLLAQLVTYFVFLSVMIASLVGYIAFVQARNTLQQAVFEQLEASATLKDDELNRWVADQRETVLLMASLPETKIQAEKLLNPDTNTEYQAAYASLSDFLTQVIFRNSNIQEAFIIRVSDGQALISTDKAREGTQHTDAEYFIQGQWGPSIQSVSVSPETGKPFMTIATPLLNEVGLQLGGVLVVQLNLERMDKIILKRAGLGESGRTYLVDKSNNLVSAESFEGQEFPQNVSSAGIESAIQGIDGSGLYLNYEGIPVIGAYHWIGPWEVALLVEMEQQEAFAPAARLAQAILLVGLISAAALAAGVYILARRITRPILSISDTAVQISEGNLECIVKVERDDEVGVLAQVFNSMTSQLRELIGSLEQRVAERTTELEESAAQAQKRASQLEAIADVASSVASLQDVDELLPYITQSISERFGFYHVGIFLLSEDKDFAVLRAANSDGGQKMLARKHQLRIGQEGIVGYSVAQKRARIALDVGEDAVFFNNPDLPATRSELTLPLIIGSEVIGALDVQSEQANAFSNEDIDVLTTLANQVAVAIENARLFQQSQAALQELDQTFQRYISNEWRQFAARSRVIGYRAYEAGLEPISYTQRSSESPSENNNIQKIPIMLRGATLGTLSVNMGEYTQAYTEEETNLIKTVADRLALALESVRLLEDSQQAAAKEQIIGEITGKIGSSINLRNVLQTAVEELGRAIPGSDIVIQLNPKIDSEAK